jgi:hypothetical protein
MMSPFLVSPAAGGNGARAYQCRSCGTLISTSDRLTSIHARTRHHCVNPAGTACDFYTFLSCPGAVARGGATAAHSWFPGYQWRLAFCHPCGEHLGWHYQALSARLKPLTFWGILVDRLTLR